MNLRYSYENFKTNIIQYIYTFLVGNRNSKLLIKPITKIEKFCQNYNLNCNELYRENLIDGLEEEVTLIILSLNQIR